VEGSRPPVISDDMLAEDGGPGARIDFEKGMSYLPRITLYLIAVNVIVFGWELATGALNGREAIIAAGALEQQRVLAGQVWRLGSATFLHGGAEHLIGNMVMLYVVGVACEHALGWKQMGSVYAVSALAGSVLSTATSAGPSVGASGAVFGVMASVVTFLVKHRERVRLRDHRVALVLAVLIVYQMVQGMMTPYVDNMAHLGGTLGGVLATLGLEPALFDRHDAPVAS
jgi:rhomboid protease GluP